MKRIIQIALLIWVMTPLSLSAQGNKKAAWSEMKNFHRFMSTTFHPSEEGNLKPLRMKADSLLIAAELWQKSSIPADFKAKETTAALKDLVEKCAFISKKVKEDASDEELKKLIGDAHEVFHHIVGECRKADE